MYQQKQGNTTHKQILLIPVIEKVLPDWLEYFIMQKRNAYELCLNSNSISTNFTTDTCEDWWFTEA